MAECMRKIACETGKMSVAERNWFSMAYKNVIKSRRDIWRDICSVERMEESHGNIHQVGLVRDFREKIEKELEGICKEILTVLHEHLIPNAENAEAQVFYHKMAGDYLRYRAEFTTGDAHAQASQDSLKSYESAMNIASADLVPTNPIRLGLALNFSVFYFEIKNDSSEAIRLAETAYNDAVANLDSMSEDCYKDSTIILQLLRENLTIWKTQPTSNDDTASNEQQQEKPSAVNA